MPPNIDIPQSISYYIMASIAMMVGGAFANALDFAGSIFLLSQMSGAAECKRHNLATEQLQRERDTWNEQRLARIDFINKKLKEHGHAEKTFRKEMKQCRLIII